MQIQQLDEYTGEVFSVVFSSNGKILVSGALVNTLRLWEMRAYYLFFDDGKTSEVLLSFAKAGEFLRHLQLEGLDIKENHPPPALKLQDGYYFNYEK